MGRDLLGLPESGQRLLLRDGFRVLRSPEQTRGLVESREEESHVGRTRSILAHGRLHVRRHVAEAGQLLPLLVREVAGARASGCGFRRRDRIFLQGRAGGAGDRRLREVARLTRIGHDVVDLQLPGQARLLTSLDGHDLRLPSVVEKGLHRFCERDLRSVATQAVGRAHACEVEDGVEDAPRAHGGIVRPRRHARPNDEQRYVRGGLIEEIAVLLLAVLAKAFAVIADDDDGQRAG